MLRFSGGVLTRFQNIGFIVLSSGVLLTPNCMPASMRSNGRFISAQHHSTFCTLIELVRPQIFSMVMVLPENFSDGTVYQDGRCVMAAGYNPPAYTHRTLE